MDKYLLTGGTGTLGQAITKALLPNADSIRILSRGELLQQQMRETFNDPKLRFLIGDVRDRDRLSRAMNGVDVVIHCAALKQVDTCGYNPEEAVKTNIFGSMNVINAAIDNKVHKVINVSSDKAVHPISIYGSTKLAAEKLFTQSNVYVGEGTTILSSVRFGNIVGSRGSFIPQLFEGKDEITVTDKEMTRYWMNIDHAAEFIIKILDIMQGGEIFVPKIPKVELMGIINAISPGSKINMIGKRVDEKLHELLFAEGENPIDMGDYFVIRR